MDVLPQLHGHSLPAPSQVFFMDSILRPITLGDEGGFNVYFTGLGTSGLPERSPTDTVSYLTTETLSPVVGQYFDQDILGSLGDYWHNFVSSGQLWALLFGIVLGYMIRNLTAY